MDNNKLFARKDGGKLILSDVTLKDGTKIEEYTINWHNDVITQNFTRRSHMNTQNIVMVFLEAYDDIIFNIAKCKKIEYVTQNKNYNGEYKEKTQIYENMRLAWLEGKSSCGTVSKFVMAFCNNNMKSSDVQKSVLDILNRENKIKQLKQLKQLKQIATRINSLLDTNYEIRYLSRVLSEQIGEKQNGD